LNFYRPRLKKILTLNNVYNYDHKLLKLKKQKWLNFLLIYKLKNFNNSKFYKFQIIDQYKILLSKNASKFSNYLYIYRYYFMCLKTIKFLYLKFKQKNNKNDKFFVNFVENKLTLILIRLKFCLTNRESNFLIKHNLISLNKYNIGLLHYVLNSGDSIKLLTDNNNYFKSLINCNKWPFPTNNIIINYKLKTFLFLRKFNIYCFNFFLPFYLKLKDIF